MRNFLVGKDWSSCEESYKRSEDDLRAKTFGSVLLRQALPFSKNLTAVFQLYVGSSA